MQHDGALRCLPELEAWEPSEATAAIDGPGGHTGGHAATAALCGTHGGAVLSAAEVAVVFAAASTAAT